MAEKRKMPEIRFNGFEGEWEEKKITEISQVFIGLVTTMTTYYRNEGTLLIRNSDIKNNHFEFSENQIFLEEQFAEENSNRRLKTGDVVTVHTGDVGTSAVVTENENGAIGFATINTRPKKGLADSNYLSVYFNADEHKSFAIKMSTGDGRSNYNLKDFFELFIPLPTLPEQTKIGTYFQNLDNLVSLQQRKYDKLLTVKKAMLEKMFPRDGADVPEIRFKDFEGKWEKKKLGDVIQCLTGGAAIKPEDYQEEGIRTIPKGAVNSTGVADLAGSKFISEDFFRRNISNNVSTNSLVTSLRDLVPTAPNLGRIVRITGEQEVFLMPQGVYKIELYKEYNDDFIITYSNSDIYRKIISAEKNGSTQVHIRNGEYLSIGIPIPCFEEQCRLGHFFNQHDTLIAQHQKELEKLKNLKKACLEKMFV